MSYKEGVIKNRFLLALVIIGITSLSGAFIAVVNSGWLSDAPVPTPAPTARIDLLQTRVADVGNLQATETPTVVKPPDTPEPAPTLTPLPSATPTPTLLPTSTPTSSPSLTNTPTVTDLPTATIPSATATPQSPVETHSAAEPSATAQPPTPLPTATEPLPPTEPPSPTASPPPASVWAELNLVPGEPQGFLNRFRLVSYYGSPLGSGLGKLGDYSRDYTLRLLRGEVAAYQALSPDRLVVPGYHMVTTVANAYPPHYRHHLELAIIEEWVATAKASGVAVVLDIQPGRANVMEEFNRVRYLLYEPHVHLAVDPEFVMNEEQVPAVNLGQMHASQINEIQAQMNGIGYEIGLNRVLIIHQFADRMLPDKELIEPYPFVELVIDGDGYGPAGTKIKNYNQYAGEPGFEYGGFKLFPTDGDDPLMSPEWVMSVLIPPPVIIIYQ